jgi:hypothetical protein
VFDTWKNDFAQANGWGKGRVAIANQARLAIITCLLVAIQETPVTKRCAGQTRRRARDGRSGPSLATAMPVRKMAPTTETGASDAGRRLTTVAWDYQPVPRGEHAWALTGLPRWGTNGRCRISGLCDRE